MEPIANARSAKMDSRTMTVCMEKRIDSKARPKSQEERGNFERAKVELPLLIINVFAFILCLINKF